MNAGAVETFTRLQHEESLLQRHLDQLDSCGLLFRDADLWNDEATAELGKALTQGTFYDLLSAMLNRAEIEPLAYGFVEYRMMQEVDALGQRAAQSQDALKALANVAALAVATLNRACQKHPVNGSKIAQAFSAWPVLHGTKPDICDDQADIVRKLKVGYGALIRLDAGARSRLKDDRGRFALLLVQIIDETRTIWRGTSPPSGGFVPKSERWMVSAGQLPRFNSDSHEKWWGVAEEMLTSLFDHPKKCPAIGKMYPDQRWHDVKRDIARRFEQFAPPPA